MDDTHATSITSHSLTGIPKNTTMVGLPERVARPLINERDFVVKEKAIESVKKCLEFEG